MIKCYLSKQKRFKERADSLANVKYVSVIDLKCEVKMAGYWPRFFFVCLWTETDRTSLVNKGFIIWLSGKFFLRDKAGSPEAPAYNNPY